jgi:hypothetical protein
MKDEALMIISRSPIVPSCTAASNTSPLMYAVPVQFKPVTQPVDYPFSITSPQSNVWPVKIAYVWRAIAQMFQKLGAATPREVSSRFQFQPHKPKTGSNVRLTDLAPPAARSERAEPASGAAADSS